MANSASQVWLPDLVDRIAYFLSRSNDVPCVLRLVNKATAAQFRNPPHTTIRLSQSTPPEEFARRWSPPGATRCLPLQQRRKLLSLTAASGSIPNLEVALVAAGCLLQAEVLEAAAGAGHKHVCQWLLQRGCPLGRPLFAAIKGGHRDLSEWLLQQDSGLLGNPWLIWTAAGAGHRHICEWLLQVGYFAVSEDAVLAAARGGHSDLADWLEQRWQATLRLCGNSAYMGPVPDLEPNVARRLGQVSAQTALLSRLLPAMAEACDLATLQRLWEQRSGELEQTEEDIVRFLLGGDGQPDAAGPVLDFLQAGAANIVLRLRDVKPQMLIAAVSGPAADWRTKAEWLEAHGCAAGEAASPAFALLMAQQDAPQRLTWLRQRGLSDEWWLQALEASPERYPTALQWLLSEGFVAPDEDGAFKLALSAAEEGFLASLHLLHAHTGGFGARPGAYEELLGAGCCHLPVMAWAAEAGGLDTDALSSAVGLQDVAQECSVQLLEWLAERGLDIRDAELFEGAAAYGCEEALDWLAERGCHMGDSGEPYCCAAYNGDLATLRALRRLGCPWGPAGKLFTKCVSARAVPDAFRVPVLSWLLEAGCPVTWRAAKRAATERTGQLAGSQELLAWLEEQHRQCQRQRRRRQRAD